jgi:N-acetylglutamate synthase-like GNAT family acetyltransferase
MDFPSLPENLCENRFMNPEELRIRRATVDDLETLKTIWTSLRLPTEGLEGRLTEFQVAEAGGQVIGALGFEIIGTSALIHNEAYLDFSFADTARELFLRRAESLAANHGVFRLWTREQVPFWTHAGFQPANAQTLARLPEAWKSGGGDWLTLELKNEDAITTALGTQFADFMDEEKKKTGRVAEKARNLNTLIIIAGFAIGILCLGIVIYLFARGNPFSR